MKRLLIANRGEIVVRIARTARERGLFTIAVFSSADRESVHTGACDLAVEIGPSTAGSPYLNIAAILEAARKTHADALHPGYGFLAENPEFAEAAQRAGMCWVGPDAFAMRTMGAKISSREAMIAADVPVVPGFQDRIADDAVLRREAAKLGFPLLVKASAGGGGRGMRRAESSAELDSALEGARREGLSAFGDATVYLEKAIDRPRHVEIQIFGDRTGRVIALGERDCSIQRRHQKIVEEAPAPSIDGETRRLMAETAIAAGRAIGYVGAGTVEFLLDRDGRFYFLEMNTRLQVEHPVTEETLGLDLVAAQLDVAEGKALPDEWGGRAARGHAIECRIYAEDPITFLPRTGTIVVYETPSGPGVRVDSGIAQGSTVGIDYDPLLAKLVVHADDRPSAVARMRRSLSQFVILGVTTNLDLLQQVVASEDFAERRIDTGFLARLPARENRRPPAAAILAAVFAAGAAKRSRPGVDPRSVDPWRGASGWRSR